MTDETNHRTQAYQRELNVAFQRLVAAHEDAIEQEVRHGSLHSETHESLEHAVITMRARLKPFVERPDLVKVWKEQGIHTIPSLCARRKRTGGGMGHFGIQSEPEVEIEHAPVWKLKQWAEAMIGIYSELGFAPEIEQGQQQTKIDDDLLREVNEWREQNL